MGGGGGRVREWREKGVVWCGVGHEVLHAQDSSFYGILQLVLQVMMGYIWKGF